MKVIVERTRGGNGGCGEPGEPFRVCFQCGECCTRYQVRLTLVEARRIADELGIAWQDLLDKYADPRWPGIDSLLLRHSNGGCVFLKHEEGDPRATCRIHSFKPSSCRDWTASFCRRECREGLARHWGLAADPTGQPQGPDEKLHAFRSFLESLNGGQKKTKRNWRLRGDKEKYGPKGEDSGASIGYNSGQPTGNSD